MSDYGGALDEAYRAVSALLSPKTPLGTSLWCIMKVGYGQATKHDPWKYYPINPARNPAILDWLTSYVKTLHNESVDRFIEEEYLSKYFVMRNWYEPASLFQLGSSTKWFLGGKEVSSAVNTNLHKFWQRYVPGNYHVLSPHDVKCPKFDAGAGIVYVRRGENYTWEHCKKGPNWPNIQDGTDAWLKLAASLVPDDWLAMPVTALIGVNESPLECLALEEPVVDFKGGPGKVRYVRKVSGNLYILGRMFISQIQNGVKWKGSRSYIGIADNVLKAAAYAEKAGESYVGTHGDDTIIYCPQCQMWHSLDWSNWDLHITARQILASLQALLDVIRPFLNAEQLRWFYALAYLAIRCPTLWCWGRNGKPSISVRRTLGHIRSGGGEFVLLNNSINWAHTTAMLDDVHARAPCKSKRFWGEVANVADARYGWLIKPDSQLSHPHGFTACRCIFTRNEGFLPRPCVSSVVRNYVNPNFDPVEWPNSSDLWMVTRYRDINKTLAWSPVGEQVMDMLDGVHRQAGIQDPFGDELSEADLSRAMLAVSDGYSARSFLESNDVSH